MSSPTLSVVPVPTAASALADAGMAVTPPAGAVTPAFSPLYRQIKDLIVRSLQAAEWGPGQAIPSEMELAARFRVSQGTVRKAVDELASENLLVRRQGKGTFVVSHAETNTQYRFLRLMADGGETAGLQRRLMGCRRTRATHDVARALGLRSGESVVEIRRILLDDQGPVVLDDIFLPGLAFKGLSAERLLQWKGPMYRLFEAEFAVTMIRAEERLRAVAADATQAEALGVASGFPLLSVERLSFTYGDRPMELRRGLYRTDRHHYRNDLS